MGKIYYEKNESFRKWLQQCAKDRKNYENSFDLVPSVKDWVIAFFEDKPLFRNFNLFTSIFEKIRRTSFMDLHIYLRRKFFEPIKTVIFEGLYRLTYLLIPKNIKVGKK